MEAECAVHALNVSQIFPIPIYVADNQGLLAAAQVFTNLQVGVYTMFTISQNA